MLGSDDKFMCIAISMMSPSSSAISEEPKAK